MAGSGAVSVHGAGMVRPSSEIDIAPQVSGRVVRIERGFQSGGHVEEGQTIFRIEDTGFQHRVQEAEVDIDARREELSVIQEEAAFARTEFQEDSKLRLDTGSIVAQPGPLALPEPQLEAAQAALIPRLWILRARDSDGWVALRVDRLFALGDVAAAGCGGATSNSTKAASSTWSGPLRRTRPTRPKWLDQLRLGAAYSETHADRMRHAQFRRQNLFVGSGVIEAGGRSVVAGRPQALGDALER